MKQETYEDYRQVEKGQLSDLIRKDSFLPGEMETWGIPPLKDFDQDVRTLFDMSFRQEVLSGHFYFETSLRTPRIPG